MDGGKKVHVGPLGACYVEGPYRGDRYSSLPAGMDRKPRKPHL